MISGQCVVAHAQNVRVRITGGHFEIAVPPFLKGSRESSLSGAARLECKPEPVRFVSMPSDDLNFPITHSLSVSTLRDGKSLSWHEYQH
jgi:hypothetical protein